MRGVLEEVMGRIEDRDLKRPEIGWADVVPVAVEGNLLKHIEVPRFAVDELDDGQAHLVQMGLFA